jgi:alpha-tubulin suppressor-like RCC1 family protein
MNDQGQLGNSQHSGDKPRPVTVGWPPSQHGASTLRDVVSIGAGDTHTCAALRSGEVWCWGDNRDGQLGDPSNPQKEVGSPALVAGLWIQNVPNHPPKAHFVSAAGQFTCAVLGDRSAWCFGLDHHGQLGNGSKSAGGRPPVPVKHIDGVTAVAAGHEQACAVSGGHVWCWGWNQVGLGDVAHTRESSVPVRIGVAGALAVATGSYHACTLLANGHRVVCWGQNGMGQLGDGHRNRDAQIPVQPVGMTDVVALAAGATHTCAIKDDGSLWCWGLNDYGQLGYRSPDQRDGVADKPVRVAGF